MAEKRMPIYGHRDHFRPYSVPISSILQYFGFKPVLNNLLHWITLTSKMLRFYIIRYTLYVQNSEFFEQNWSLFGMHFVHNCNHQKFFTGQIFQYF